MMSCWQFCPDSRPTASELVDLLSRDDDEVISLASEDDDIPTLEQPPAPPTTSKLSPGALLTVRS